MTTVDNYVTYGGLVGIFHEWHHVLFRLLQTVSPGGAQGYAYLYRFTRESIDDISQKRNGFTDTTGYEEEEEEDLLRSMFAMHHKDADSFTLEDIGYHMILNVLAGGETVAISLSAAVYYICKDAVVMNKLRHELDEKRENGEISVPITFKEAQGCTYLQSIIKESLRLHPVIGHGLPRVIPNGGMTLAGRFFPEKVKLHLHLHHHHRALIWSNSFAQTIVGINAWVASANREVFGEDADDFRPERWFQDAESVSRMDQYVLTV